MRVPRCVLLQAVAEMTARHKRLAVNAFIAALKGDEDGMNGRVTEIASRDDLREIAEAARKVADSAGLRWASG